MLELQTGNIDFTTLFIVLFVVAAFLVQLLLCFKVKKTIIRLLPVILLSVSIAAFWTLASLITGWDAVACAIFAMLSGYLLLACCAGWAVFGIVGFVRRQGGK